MIEFRGGACESAARENGRCVLSAADAVRMRLWVNAVRRRVYQKEK
jgi:hypothetical protein